MQQNIAFNTDNTVIELHRLGTCETGRQSGYFFSCDSVMGLNELQRDWAGKLQVIYLDPPFFTGQKYKYRHKAGDVILNNDAYSDKWTDKESFLDMLKGVLLGAKQLLSDTGSIFVHLDYRVSAHARILMDDIFGEENLVNEIIWNYKSGGRSKKHFSRKHDTILFYRKTDKHYFDIEAVGKVRGRQKRNNMKKGVDEDGRIFWSINSNGKEYRYYEDSKVYPSDVWDDISHLQQKDPERTGYDTQKPEELLKRIILSSSKPGDWVGDFFAGSGTTLAVAQKSGRNWIGMDSGIFSLHTSRKRLISCADNNDVSFVIPADLFAKNTNNKIKFEIHEKINQGRPEVTVRFTGYSCDPVEGLNHYMDFIDYWALGTMDNGIFSVVKQTYRTYPKGNINSELTLANAYKDELVLHVVDIFGEQSMVPLTGLR